MPRPPLRAAAIAAVYLGAIALYVYAILDPAVTFANDVTSGLVLGALAVLNVAAGWLAGGWWALALPALAVPLGIPATFLVALGVGARRLGPRRRAA